MPQRFSRNEMLNSVDLVPHRGSRVIVPLCLRRPKIFVVCISWVQNFFLVAVSWVRIFLWRVFGGLKFFFVGPKVGILWFHDFFLAGVS